MVLAVSRSQDDHQDKDSRIFFRDIKIKKKHQSRCQNFGHYSRRLLWRYYSLIENQPPFDFSYAEAALLVEAIDYSPKHGIDLEDYNLDLFGSVLLQSATRKGLFSKWNVEPAQLETKIRKLNSLRLLVLIDALERFHTLHHRQADESLSALQTDLIAVSLIKAKSKEIFES